MQIPPELDNHIEPKFVEDRLVAYMYFYQPKKNLIIRIRTYHIGAGNNNKTSILYGILKKI